METQKPSQTRRARAGATSANSRRIRRELAGIAVVAIAIVLIGGRLPGSDSRREAEQYIRWHHTIALTPEQEAVKQEALEAIPAPCCSSFSMATCCCPCNLAKAAWGLAAHDVAVRGYDAAAVRRDVERWLASINPRGSAGDACERGRCDVPFHHDGCGGMHEEHVS
jgi:hypothetical protein